MREHNHASMSYVTSPGPGRAMHVGTSYSLVPDMSFRWQNRIGLEMCACGTVGNLTGTLFSNTATCVAN